MPPWTLAPISFAAVVLGVYAHRHWFGVLPEDPPGVGRHQHALPTPMCGFIPVVVAVGALLACGAPFAVAAAILIASVTGFLDDRGKARGVEMAWQTKGLALAVAAVLLLSELPGERTPTDYALAFVWIFALTNAVNFMDNTDGVSTSLGALGLLAASGGTGPASYAGFAFLGFLPANWPNPRVFLGDSGSLGLGVCLAWATLPPPLAPPLAPPLDPPLAPSLAQATEPFWHALLPVAVFALDFTQVILARLALGVPPWVGDRRHLTHISMVLGLPRVLVAPLFAGLAGALWFGFA